jgi:hypothetical protein
VAKDSLRSGDKNFHRNHRLVSSIEKTSARQRRRMRMFPRICRVRPARE